MKKFCFTKKHIEILLYTVLFGLIFYFINNFMYAFSSLKGLEALNYLETTTKRFVISLKTRDVGFGLLAGGAFYIYMIFKMKNRRNTRDKEEYGSARWGRPDEIKPFMDLKDRYNNIILSSRDGIRMNGWNPGRKYNLNKNVLVIGGAGTRKTTGYVIPNLLQCHSSYIVTDPKGTILNQVGMTLYKRGYKILVLNLKDADSVKTQSMRYNPFHFIKSELDILTLVDVLIDNTSGKGAESKRDFWVSAEKLLYLAFIDYLRMVKGPEDRNFQSVLKMIRQCETREDDEEFKNAIDLEFEKIKKDGVWKMGKDKKPYFIAGEDLFCVGKYEEYKLSAGKTAKSILISCAARLSPFGISEIAELTKTNDIDIESIGEEKTALFVIISDTNKTLNFIAAMFYTQLFDTLAHFADTKHRGELPVAVRCILDEFANTGTIPNFENTIATIRSRRISADIILQTFSQLKANYKDHYDVIVACCASTVFLGGKDKTTLKEFVELLGKETVDVTTTGTNRNRGTSHSTNYQRISRELKTIDELAVLDGDMSVVFLQGVRAFLSPKFDLKTHPRYRETADYNEKMYFDVKKYVQFMRKKKQQDELKKKGEEETRKNGEERLSNQDIMAVLKKNNIEDIEINIQEVIQ